MKRIFTLTIIVGILICAVSATSFHAERTIGHFTEIGSRSDNAISYDRAVGDIPTEPETEPATDTEETRTMETFVRVTPTTEETVGETETTVEETVVPTEAETVTETTVESTPTEPETPATDDSVPPTDPKKPHPGVKQTGDNALLFVGIGMMAVALILLIGTSRKRAYSSKKK